MIRYLQHPHGDPFSDGSTYKYEMGADLKRGLTGNLNLNATLNPDFGQVEMDPAMVNLSDFETYFQEKAPRTPCSPAVSSFTPAMSPATSGAPDLVAFRRKTVGFEAGLTAAGSHPRLT